ncbi:MAG: hypothetical protein NTW87_00640 [Planctomycetota bacterium]|nr:hypothetical protein [Planctomycetota bacterium]
MPELQEKKSRLIGPSPIAERFTSVVARSKRHRGAYRLESKARSLGATGIPDIERACDLAAGHGAFRLRELRALIKEPVEQQQLEFMAEHPVSLPVLPDRREESVRFPERRFPFDHASGAGRFPRAVKNKAVRLGLPAAVLDDGSLASHERKHSTFRGLVQLRLTAFSGGQGTWMARCRGRDALRGEWR